MKKIFYLTIICFVGAQYECLNAAQSDTSIILTHLHKISKTTGFRTHDNLNQLNETADYIEQVFNKYSDSIYLQKYLVHNREYRNVICSFGTENDRRIIIGAHYDVCEEQEGADDNASGVTGLLELARLLEGKKLNFRIDLVAYTLEEPPFFRSEFMGSFIHASFLHDNEIDVYGMISLEMIGYFSDEKKSQSYPIGILSLIYGKKANYITLVKKWGSGSFARKFSRKFKSRDHIKTKKFSGPASLPGIDFSDHLNYWKYDFSALMITDTAFYRNKNYHEKSDKLETLNISKMASVIDTVYEAILLL